MAKFISNDRSSAQTKPKDKKEENLISLDIFSLSRYTSLVILLFFSQFSVALVDFCVFFHPFFYLLLAFSSILFFFQLLPLAEGPNSDTLSRIRVSVSLRIYLASAAAAA